MEIQSETALVNYDRIKKAIDYIGDNFKKQPSLEEIAAAVYLSPTHFRRMFQEWVGITPKKFLQYISLEHAKKLLREQDLGVSDATYEIGLSSTSRLHDLFVSIESMSPSEFKKGGKDLSIKVMNADTDFGSILIASTEKGICHVGFRDDDAGDFETVHKMFPKARIEISVGEIPPSVLEYFSPTPPPAFSPLKLHLKGTPFQIKVWEALLRIPYGGLSSYAQIARQIGNPKAHRAVGTAIGDNPIALIIPCHRVIQATGHLGGYRWGIGRKAALLGCEAVLEKKRQ